jgi:hypothetical protein
MKSQLFLVEKVWHYRFFQIDDNRAQQSTDETDRKLAEKAAARAKR